MSSVKEEIEKLRARLANKDNEDADGLKAATDELQQKSLKLFEIAYRKVSSCWCMFSVHVGLISSMTPQSGNSDCLSLGRV